MSAEKVKKNHMKKYFFSDVIYQLGSGFSFIALNWYALQNTKSAKSVGLMMTFDILGRLVASSFSGVIIDNFNRKHTLIFCNLFRAVFILIILIFIMNKEFNLIYLSLLAFAGGAGLTFYLTASKAFVQEVAKKNEVIKWQSYGEISVQSSLLLSGALTGFFYNAWGFNFILKIEIAALLAGVVILLSIDHDKAFSNVLKENFISSHLKGYLYLKYHPILLIYAVTMTFPYLATVASNTILPYYTISQLNADVSVYGLMLTSYGCGGVVAGLMRRYIFSKNSCFTATHAFLFISTLSLIFLFFNHIPEIAYCSFFIFGLANSSLKIISQSILIKNISHIYMGRVFSSMNFFSTVLQIGATFLGSVMIADLPQIPSCAFLIFLMLIGYFLFVCLNNRFKPLYMEKITSCTHIGPKKFL